jgi:hypothetical protein
MTNWGSALGLPVALALAANISSAGAQQLNPQQIQIIRDTAASICNTAKEAKGQKSDIQIQGDVKAQLGGLVGKLVDAGASGKGSLSREEFEGLSRDATAAALEGDRVCRERLFNKMFDKATSSDTKSEIPQAEHMTAWLIPYDRKQDNPNVHYEGLRLRNASDQVIYDVIAELVAVQGAFRKTAVGDSEERNLEFGVLVGNLPPGEMTTRIGGAGGAMNIRLGIEIAFQDTTGRFWLRHGNGLLEQVSKHPLDLYGISRPVYWEH